MNVETAEEIKRHVNEVLARFHQKETAIILPAVFLSDSSSKGRHVVRFTVACGVYTIKQGASAVEQIARVKRILRAEQELRMIQMGLPV